jgi:hypothetical protein
VSAAKIIAGLKDAIAGRWARATLYDGGKPVQRYSECRACTNCTLTIKGRCDLCGARKIFEEQSAPVTAGKGTGS